jgi:hypothetical protein
VSRAEVFALIHAERVAQDKIWRTGRPSEVQYKFAAPHVLLLEENLAKLRSFWYMSSKEEMTDRFIKIAALATRALEEIE